MKTANEFLEENTYELFWHETVVQSMEKYADLKTKEYQEAIEHLIGMNRHYLKFIDKSEETDPLRIEQKEDFIDIINQHLEKYKHLLPKIDKEKN